MTPDDWIKLAPDAVTALAATLAGVGALKGVNTWRKQLKGQHTYDAARRTYLAMLKLREAISSMRAPFIPVDEFMAAAQAEGIQIKSTDDLLSDQVSYAVQRLRWSGVVTPLHELEASVLEAEVVISPEVRQVFARLQKHIWRLKWALDHHLRRRADPRPPSSPVSTFEKEQMDVLNRPVDGDDTYEQELEAIVRAFADVLKPHLA